MRVLTTILFLAAGCVGSIGDENPGDGSDDDVLPDGKMGRAVFKRDVHPALLKCSGAGCHETTAVSAALSKFYTADGDASYDATVASPRLVDTYSSIAPIITHVQAGHQNVTYTPDEQSKIVNWLSIEADERKGTDPGPPPVDPVALLREWSGCLSLENFNAANMTQAWNGLAADNLQACKNCHNGGVAGFLIMTDAQQYFAALSSTAAYMLKYFSVNTVEKKVVINTASFESANKIAGHPTFPAATNAGMTALQALYDSTMLRLTAAQCDQPRLME